MRYCFHETAEKEFFAAMEYYEACQKINKTDDPEILNNFLKQGVQVKTIDQFEFIL